MKYPKVSANFSTIMNIRKLKAQDLADLSGIGKSSISHYVNGTHCPSNDTAQILADVLKVNPLWLMGLDDRMEKEPVATDSLSKDFKEFLELFNNSDKEHQELAVLALKSGQHRS